MKPMQVNSDYYLSENYPSLFKRYIESTDEKKRIAEALIERVKDKGYKTLLDMGAGDGMLTGMLAKHLERIYAVEKNQTHREKLKKFPNVRVIVEQMEKIGDKEIKLIEKPEIVLFCYSLCSLKKDWIAPTLKSAFDFLAPGGEVLYISFKDGCQWDLYTTELYRKLGLLKRGGIKQHDDDILNAGYRVKCEREIPSSIHASSLEELYKNLTFFFMPFHPQYLSSFDEYGEILQRYATVNSDGSAALAVTQEIKKITLA